MATAEPVTREAVAVPVQRRAADEPAHPPRRLFRLRLRARRAPCWYEEIAFILASYWVYSLIRNGVPEHQRLALDRAGDLLNVERWLHIDVELWLNKAVAGIGWLATASNYWYATTHFVVTIGVLVWAYKAHPLQYRSLRTALYVANCLALFGYWLYPLAPPRLMSPNPGYVDTIVVYDTWGSWGSAGVASHSNQFAAMPSMHLAWALWAAIVVVALARRRWVRVAGAAYPVVTLFVIVATGNHFLLDAVAGAAVLALGFGVQRLLHRRPAVQRSLLTPRPQSLATSRTTISRGVSLSR